MSGGRPAIPGNRPWGQKLSAEEAPKEAAPRQEAIYRCAKGHTRAVPFAAGIEPPPTWDCRCGGTARLDGAPEDTPAETHLPGYADGGKNWQGDGWGTSPMEQLRKRRTPEEGDAILAARMAEVKQTGVAR